MTATSDSARTEKFGDLARQAEDDTLFAYARRIEARAIERCGELLAEIPSATGAHLKSGDAPTLSRKDAARDAGLSRDQAVTALRVANVPKEQFEALVDKQGAARAPRSR